MSDGFSVKVNGKDVRNPVLRGLFLVLALAITVIVVAVILAILLAILIGVGAILVGAIVLFGFSLSLII